MLDSLQLLFIMDGKNREPVEKLSAGDIGATLKLKYTKTKNRLNRKFFIRIDLWLKN